MLLWPKFVREGRVESQKAAKKLTSVGVGWGGARREGGGWAGGEPAHRTPAIRIWSFLVAVSWSGRLYILHQRKLLPGKNKAHTLSHTLSITHTHTHTHIRSRNGNGEKPEGKLRGGGLGQQVGSGRWEAVGAGNGNKRTRDNAKGHGQIRVWQLTHVHPKDLTCTHMYKVYRSY